MIPILTTLAAILPGWIVVFVLSRALLRERRKVRRLRAELRARGPSVIQGRGVFTMHGSAPVGSVVAVNDDGTVSVAIGDGKVTG